jgi:hypothetical protein
VTEAKTLPDHERCNSHRHYKLSCAQYEGLLAESGHACQICRRPARELKQRKLHIDHCGSLWAVRGLLCISCNGRLRDGRHSPEWAAEYLAATWWERQCAVIGVPAGRSPEPPVGSAIRNQWGIVWINPGGGIWRTPNQGGHSWPGLFWPSLRDSYGPHNLVPFDLAAALGEGGAEEFRWEIEREPFWAPVRATIGLTEPERKPSTPELVLNGHLGTPEDAARTLRSRMSREDQMRLARILLEAG